ncbi:hypothetical protein BDW66DRAFT_136073 [Aspergillus desertorum]
MFGSGLCVVCLISRRECSLRNWVRTGFLRASYRRGPGLSVDGLEESTACAARILSSSAFRLSSSPISPSTLAMVMRTIGSFTYTYTLSVVPTAASLSWSMLWPFRRPPQLSHIWSTISESWSAKVDLLRW